VNPAAILTVFAESVEPPLRCTGSGADANGVPDGSDRAALHFRGDCCRPFDGEYVAQDGTRAVLDCAGGES
jgi:hypothetical protein